MVSGRRAAGLMQGYQGGDGKLAGADDDHYRSGDVVFVDDDGYFTFVGRSDDVFESSDYRISPFDALFALPGAFDGLPKPITEIGRWLPMSRVIELIHQGMTGSGRLMDAVAPVLVLSAWVVVAGWATRRWFRWEPRR